MLAFAYLFTLLSSIIGAIAVTAVFLAAFHVPMSSGIAAVSLIGAMIFSVGCFTRMEKCDE